MKPAVLIVCSVLAAPSPARADESAEVMRVVRVVVVAPAPPYVVEAATCTLSGMRGEERVLDVRYQGRRCGAEARSRDALSVRAIADGDKVVLETDARSADVADVTTVLDAAAVVLNQRITDANATVSSVAREPTRVAWSPELQQLGIGLAVVGLLALTAGVVMLSVDNPDAHFVKWSDPNLELAGAITLAVGAGLVVLGGPMWVAGSHKVARVTASMSPAGGSLRVTF